MAGYLSDDIINTARAMFEKHHLTFAQEDITVYQKSKPVISSQNSNFNMLYSGGNPSAENIEYSVISNIYKARVRFPQDQKNDMFTSKQDRKSEDQLNISLNDGRVRIIVDPVAAEAIKTCERIIIRNKIYVVESDEAPKGLFSPQFFTFYLKTLN